jgi:S-adenosylmethionine hydrolase
MAAHLAAGVPFESVGPVVDPANLVALEFPAPTRVDDRLEVTAVYVDSFGNVRFAATPRDLPVRREATGELPVRGEATGDVAGRSGTFELLVADRPAPAPVPLVRTFGEVAAGQPLLYEDSNGSLALGVNQGHAAAWLGLDTGARVTIRPERTNRDDARR